MHMSTEVEEMLRDGMERFTAGVTAPDGLARAAWRLHRQRMRVRATAAFGGIAVAAAASVVIASVAASGAPATLTPAQQRHIAYVTSRVESALESQDLVAVESSQDGSVTWAYGSRYNWVQYWPAIDHRDRVVNGQHQWDFPPRDAGQPDTAAGTAIVGGKLVWAYVTYADHRYSVVPNGSGPAGRPGSACSTDGRLAMGGVPVPGDSWPDFINATLKCGAASVTGNVEIHGAETTEITGKPVTVKLSPGYAKAVHEQWATVRWSLYVDPVTYLPVRMYGSTQTYGGSAGDQTSSAVTDMTWLRASPANVAKALVTIPPGFQLYTGPAGGQ
jgi:hypothetical protein